MAVFAQRYHDICAGHRVVGQGGKCENLHGHNYRIHFKCKGVENEIDGVGRVIDFGLIKSILCMWLEDNWDHKMILWAEDPIMKSIRAVDPTVFSVPFNPTAENMAKHLVEVVAPLLLSDRDIEVVEITIEETAKCSATYTKD